MNWGGHRNIQSLRVPILNFLLLNYTIVLNRGPHPPGHGPVPVRGLLRTGGRTSGGERRASKWKLHLYLPPLLITRIIAWAPPPVRSAAALDSRRSPNPTVNCACEGSRLHAPYENLMPDDQLQIQIIISREVWLHGDHNTSIACRLISKPYQ